MAQSKFSSKLPQLLGNRNISYGWLHLSENTGGWQYKLLQYIDLENWSSSVWNYESLKYCSHYFWQWQKSDGEFFLSLNFRRKSVLRQILMEKHLRIPSEFFKTYSIQMKILSGTSQNEVTQEKWKDMSEMAAPCTVELLCGFDSRNTHEAHALSTF